MALVDGPEALGGMSEVVVGKLNEVTTNPKDKEAGQQVPIALLADATVSL